MRWGQLQPGDLMVESDHSIWLVLDRRWIKNDMGHSENDMIDVTVLITTLTDQWTDHMILYDRRINSTFVKVLRGGDQIYSNERIR